MVGASAQHGEVFGPYLVYEQLGSGGMATVHRATKAGLAGFERPVGLKRLLPHLAQDADFVRAFVREAKLAALLHHANIVQIYELGRVGGAYFMATEYVQGRDLRQLVRRASRQALGIPIGVVVALLAELCDALDYAHTRTDDVSGAPLGIVHRDVSPSNLLVTSDGHLKVIDFGIAKAASEVLCAHDGRARDKLAYRSPEALNGSALDARSDIFSAGVVAHELLSGRALFTSREACETLRKIQRGEVLPPSTYNADVPVQLDELVLTALATAPADRFATAAAMRAALHDVTRACHLRATGTEVAAWLATSCGDPLAWLPVDSELAGDASDSARSATVRRAYVGSSRANVVSGPAPAGLAPRITFRGDERRLPLPLPPPPPLPQDVPKPPRLARGTSSPPLRAPSTNRPPGVPLPARPRKTAERPAVPEPVIAPPPSEEPRPLALLALVIALALVVIALAAWLGVATGPW